MGEALSRMLKAIIFLFAAIMIVHGFALGFQLYWKNGWLDNILHFSGGIWVALVFLWLVKKFPRYASFSQSKILTIFAGLSMAALIGVGWEFFEYSFDWAIGNRWDLPRAQLGLVDTMSDLFFDLFGALIALLGFAFLSTKNQES